MKGELALLRRDQALHRVMPAACWSPAIIVALLLALGFNFYAPGTTGPPAWADRVLNFLALGFFVSLVLCPCAVGATFLLEARMRARAERTLPGPEPAAYPLRAGEVLGRWVVRSCGDGRVEIRRSVFPRAVTLVINAALAASAWMLLDLLVRGSAPNPVVAAPAVGVLMLMLLLVYALANADQTVRGRSAAGGVDVRFRARRVPPLRWKVVEIRVNDRAELRVRVSSGAVAVRAGERRIEIGDLGWGRLGRWNAERLARELAPGALPDEAGGDHVEGPENELED